MNSAERHRSAGELGVNFPEASASRIRLVLNLNVAKPIKIFNRICYLLTAPDHEWHEGMRDELLAPYVAALGLMQLKEAVAGKPGEVTKDTNCRLSATDLWTHYVQTAFQQELREWIQNTSSEAEIEEVTKMISHLPAYLPDFQAEQGMKLEKLCKMRRRQLAGQQEMSRFESVLATGDIQMARRFLEETRKDKGLRGKEGLSERLLDQFLHWLLKLGKWEVFDQELKQLNLHATLWNFWMENKAARIAEHLRAKLLLDADQARILASLAKTIRVTARAGSGKTRLLCAMSCFLVDQYGYKPDEILLLAFNKNAADELESRLIELLGVPAFPGARTFHSLAYGIAQPEENLVMDQGKEVSAMQLTALVQELLRESLDDETREQIYQLFRHEAELDQQTGSLLTGEARYDFRRSLKQFTLSGRSVKSAGEKYIDDFLFEHGVEAYYESPFRWDGGWYRPDFKIKTGAKTYVILEHWAVDPDRFDVIASRAWPEGKQREYQQVAKKKREYWKRKQVPLIETCARECNDREGFEEVLRQRLSEHLGSLQRLPRAELLERVVEIHLSNLAQFIAQAIQRSQKLGWDHAELASALSTYDAQTEREAFFHRLVLRVFRTYGAALKRQGKIDFDRLFNRAIALMQADPPRTIVSRKDTSLDLRKLRVCLVDEAQDLSPQFLRAIDCLRSLNPDLRLIFVGDDWQAINRFAGSSVELFTEKINNRFGKCAPATLATNYRSCAQIVEAGNALMRDQGRPANAHHAGFARIERVCYDQVWVEVREGQENYEMDAPFRPAGGAAAIVKTIYQLVLPDLLAGKSVGVLFRNNSYCGVEIKEAERTLIHAFRDFGWPGHRVETWRDEKLTFSTAHKFKGAERDTIFIVGPHEGSFPLINATSIELFRFFGDSLSQAVDDERRLFYVALTRARQRVVLVCESSRTDESPFLEPLIEMIIKIPVPNVLIRPDVPPPQTALAALKDTGHSSPDSDGTLLPESKVAS